MNERADAELPGRWRVRFLNGALRGRTIGLKPGMNVIGSAPDCDIVLHGDVMPQHLMLSAGEIAVSIQKLGVAAARLNGEELSLHRRSGAPGDVISAGGVDFELDRMEADSRSPDRSRAGARAQRPSHAASAREPPAPLEDTDGATTRAGSSVSRSGVVIVAVGAAMGIAAGFGWHASASTGSTPPPPIASVPDWRDVIPAVADFPEVQVAAGPNGKALIKGYVESRMRKTALLAAVQRFGGRVDVNVQTAEELLEQARRYIDEPGVDVRHVGSGQLIVSGRVLDEAVREKIRRLGQDLKPTLSLVDQVQYGPDVAPDGDGTVELASWESALPSPVVGITEYAGGVRHIQLANGDRYYEGAQLKLGNELTHIEAGAGRLIIKKSRAAMVEAAASHPTRNVRARE